MALTHHALPMLRPREHGQAGGAASSAWEGGGWGKGNLKKRPQELISWSLGQGTRICGGWDIELPSNTIPARRLNPAGRQVPWGGPGVFPHACLRRCLLCKRLRAAAASCPLVLASLGTGKHPSCCLLPPRFLMAALHRHSTPRPEHRGAPSSLPTLAKPWEAGSTHPLCNTSARFPGNLKQSKSSPRHASPSSVAGGHWGELRGRKDEGNQNVFLQPSACFPKSFAAPASEPAITKTWPLSAPGCRAGCFPDTLKSLFAVG